MKNKFIKLLAGIMVLTVKTMYSPIISLAEDEEVSQEVELEMNIESDDNSNNNDSIDDSIKDENDEPSNNKEIGTNDNNIEDNIDNNVNDENDNEQQENKTSDESEISGELSDENITVFSLDEDSDFDETQTETETIENVTNVTNDDAWNNACQEDQYTRIYGQKAEDGSINYENLKNFDVPNNTVVSRPTKYFVEVTANNKAVLVP